MYAVLFHRLTPASVAHSTNLSNPGALCDDIGDYNSDGFAESGAAFTGDSVQVVFDLGSSYIVTGVRAYASG